MNPTLLVILLVVVAVGAIVVSQLVVDPSTAELVRGAGIFLLGLAVKRPGDLPAGKP